MGPSGRRDIKRTHSLFVHNLQQYQENHTALKDVIEDEIAEGSRTVD